MGEVTNPHSTRQAVGTVSSRIPSRPSLSAEEAWTLVRRAYPYRHLERTDFEGCLNYLSGRNGDGRDWLPARIKWAGDAFRINNDSCTNACKAAACGDGYVQGTEQCDDGNTVNTDSCTSSLAFIRTCETWRGEQASRSRNSIGADL